MSGSRTIVIGLDSVDLTLVERFGSSGEMPVLRDLLANNPVAQLETPSRVLQGSIWPSLLTGMSPGHHGHYLQDQLRSGSYHLGQTYSNQHDLPYFYSFLNAAGVRCGIADVPGDRPFRGLNGVQVIDWATEFQYSGYATVPRHFAMQLLMRVGRNPFTRQPSSGDSQDEHRLLCERLEKSTRQKCELGKYLIGRRDLGMVFFVFGEPHKAGHWLWRYFDEDYPAFEAADVLLRDGLLNNYRQIDRSLAELLERMSPDDNLIVFADHGMQAAYRGDHLIDLLLERLGLLTLRSSAAVDPAAKVRSSAGALHRKARQTAKRWLPPAILNRLETKRDSFPDVDWHATRAFSLPTDRNSYVRLNLAGREPQGIVPHDNYQAILDSLEAELTKLVNTATGRPAVRRVFRVHELYPGPRVEDLPDVAILWSAEAPIIEVESPTVGKVTRQFRELRSGNHREEGFLVARGPGFSEAARRFKGHILQIAPTILQLHDVPIPAHYEMPPISGLFG